MGLRIGDALLNLQGLGRWALFVHGPLSRPDRPLATPFFASVCLGVPKREACSPSPTSDLFENLRLRRSQGSLAPSSRSEASVLRESLRSPLRNKRLNLTVPDESVSDFAVHDLFLPKKGVDGLCRLATKAVLSAKPLERSPQVMRVSVIRHDDR